MYAEKARFIVDRFQHRLEELHGLYICGQVDDFKLSKAKLESDIDNQYASEEADLVKRKVQTILFDGDHGIEIFGSAENE